MHTLPLASAAGTTSTEARPSSPVAISTDWALSAPKPAAAPPVIVYFTIQSETGAFVVCRSTQVVSITGTPVFAQAPSGKCQSASTQMIRADFRRTSHE
jgi:hypothetical protein